MRFAFSSLLSSSAQNYSFIKQDILITSIHICVLQSPDSTPSSFRQLMKVCLNCKWALFFNIHDHRWCLLSTFHSGQQIFIQSCWFQGYILIWTPSSSRRLRRRSNSSPVLCSVHAELVLALICCWNTAFGHHLHWPLDGAYYYLLT